MDGDMIERTWTICGRRVNAATFAASLFLQQAMVALENDHPEVAATFIARAHEAMTWDVSFAEAFLEKRLPLKVQGIEVPESLPPWV